MPGVSASSPSHVARSRSRCPGIPVRIAEGADGQDLLGASLSLAQTQIAGQLAEETSLDARAMGVLGFTGALIGADIAVRELLGTGWWIPLIPLGLAAIVCLSSVLGPHLSRVDFGPAPGTFYSSYSGQPFALARRQLSTGALMSTDPHTTKPRPPIPPAPVPIELPGPSGIPHMSPSGEIPPPSWYEELFMRVFGPRQSKRRRSG